MRPLTQLLNSNDAQAVDFAYQYLHANSEATLYPPDDAVKNLIRMSAYMDKKLGLSRDIRFNRRVNEAEFDPATSSREFSIFSSDYGMAVLGAWLGCCALGVCWDGVADGCAFGSCDCAGVL